MPVAPLQPFSPPAALLSYLPAGISQNAVLLTLLAFVFICWGVYTIVAVYHWFRYSHASWVAGPAIGVHLVVSFLLAVYALSGTLPF